MSLNFDLSKIPSWETVCYETLTDTPEAMAALVAECRFFGPSWAWADDRKSVRRMSVTTNTLVFATMSIGVGNITAANWQEVYTRLTMHERVFGALRIGPDGESGFTPEEVRAHIGLHTNVRDESKAWFHAHLVRNLRLDAGRTLRAERALPQGDMVSTGGLE